MNVKSMVLGRSPHKVWLVVALSLMLIPISRASAKGIFYYDFNDSLKPWAAAAESIGKTALIQMSEDDPTSERPTNVFAALQAGQIIFNPQRQAYAPLPVGTWMVARFDAAEATLVRVELLAKSVQNCEGCGLKLYVGEKAPERITQFAELGELVTKWQGYKYEKKFVSKLGRSPGPYLYVAIGWSGTDAVVGFDNVTIQAMP